MFVKFGQIASTRRDLLPEMLTTELADLQSAVRPVAGDEVRVMVESELHATIEEEFASFDFEPFASASIGQTHRAVLNTGEHVVVKVQRPGIEDIVQRDAAVLRLIAGQIERRVEGARQIGVKRLADELISSLLRAQLQRRSRPAPSRSSKPGERSWHHRSDRLPGALHPPGPRHGRDRREDCRGRRGVAASPIAAEVLASRLLRAFLDQVLRDGLYHGDPHPGNIFVDRKARCGSSTSAPSAGSTR